MQTQIKLYLNRDIFTTAVTLGRLAIAESRFTCFTLEDVARALGVKIYGETAICAGEHNFILTHSNKFERVLPLIYNQDDYSLEDRHGARWTGIRMHNGNNHAHTDGCPLLGYERGEKTIWKKAADDLVSELYRLGMNDGDTGKILISNIQKR